MEYAYFDHNASTPVSPEVLNILVPVLANIHGNASSIHYDGQVAKQCLEYARKQVASLIHAEPREIVFVSGGTEADNLAIFGTVRHAERDARHVITTAIEHPAVLAACEQLEREGVAVTRVGVSSDGVVDPDDIRRALRPETVLISVMHANNELGTVQPLEAISRIAQEAGVIFHSDGVQAVGKVLVNVKDLGVSLYSFTGHKIGALKGAGALRVRNGTRLGSIQFGGHHERDRRPGTENVPGAVALGAAAQWIEQHFEAETARVRALRERLETAILEQVPDTHVNCRRALRTPNTSNIVFEGLAGEALVIALNSAGFAVSSGAACSSGAVEPSHVLTAIGLTPERARASIRFSLGRTNDAEQVDRLVSAVGHWTRHLRTIAPQHAHAR